MHTTVYTADDREAWEETLPARVSVFGSVGYARIVQRHTGYPARLFVAASDEGRIAYPFFLRPVGNLPFARQYEARWDTLTPEYTGPIGLGNVTPDLQHAFIEGWRQFCNEQRVVAEFMHLHPSDRCNGMLRLDNVRYDRDIVVIDLTLSEEELWRRSFGDQTRYSIRRAQREGVRVFTVQNADDVREFHRIYTKTMNRHRAHARYFFSFEYFWSFCEELPEHATFLLAEYSGHIVAAALYLHDDLEMYDFLAGLDIDYQRSRAAHAVVYAAIQWGQRHGKRRLIMGGGYRPNDGVFQFKASFSPLRLRFSTYRHIRNPALYADLCQAWTEYYGCSLPGDTAYFPAYRMLPSHDEGRAREVGS